MPTCPTALPSHVKLKSLDTCLAGLWDNSFLDYVEKHPKTTIGEIFDAVHKDVARTSKEAKGVVPVDMVPKHLAMWRAIRADKSELAEAMKQYEEEVFKVAKKEVEAMRLARAAMKTPAEMCSADCVKELTNAFVKKCGPLIPNICLPGVSVPNVDFDAICL
ncbi:hypothetical protein WA556_005363 [Blastocystis sp. ATCC 50177/Nand II]